MDTLCYLHVNESVTVKKKEVQSLNSHTRFSPEHPARSDLLYFTAINVRLQPSNISVQVASESEKKGRAGTQSTGNIRTGSGKMVGWLVKKCSQIRVDVGKWRNINLGNNNNAQAPGVVLSTFK